MKESLRINKPLEGQVAVVAGATRGAGRGIARMLGEAGATVYCSGRSIRGRPATPSRPETIEETADLVTAAGGLGVPVQVDHSLEEQVRALFARVRREHGRLDLLVNDIWGGDELTEWGKPFWELEVEKGLLMLQRAVHTHIITSRHGAPLMVERNTGLIVEVTDGDFFGYRGNLFYNLAKSTAIRLAYAMAADLRDRGVTSLAVTPGFLRSEAMLDRFGVTEANWQDAVRQDPHFAESETPCYVGRAVAALAADPNVSRKAGKVWASWTLAKEYGFRDLDGRRPDFGSYFDRTVTAILDRGGPANEDERFLVQSRYDHLHLDPTRTDETRRMAAILWPAEHPQGTHD
ncbi:MAG: SDR family oxidoreductase [Nitrospiraceae bacterium]